MSIDDLLLEWSYKCERGYPEIDNPSDMLILESILRELDMPVEEVIKNLKEEEWEDVQGDEKNISQDISDGIEILKKELDLDDEHFLNITKNKIKIWIPRRDRGALGGGIESINGFEKVKDNVYKYGSTTFVVKPVEAQFGDDAGKKNERLFINSINETIKANKGNIDIVLKASGGKVIELPDIKKAYDSSKIGASPSSDEKGGFNIAKSDVQLISIGPTFNISLKQDKFLAWESLRRRWKEEFDNIINNADAGLIGNFQRHKKGEQNGIGINPEDKSIVYQIELTNHPKEKDESIVFGSERDVIVVGKTFEPGDFDFDGKTLTIQVSHIFKNIGEVEEAGQSPSIVLQRHVNMPYMIDFRARPANSVKPSIKLDWNTVTQKMEKEEKPNP